MNLVRNKYQLFRRLNVVTLIAVYLLILVGGIVRSTGSGMGCPDWPKCFGSWIPPTEEGQLPSNYKEVFAAQRLEKNERLAEYLGALGFANLADQLVNDPMIAEEADFNAAKTWTEYLNRLLGAVIGLLLLATAFASLVYWKKDRALVYTSMAAVAAVAFQGWIGSVVVSTNLLPWMVTLHMLIALVIVCLLIYMVSRSKADENRYATTNAASRTLNITLLTLLAITLVQIVLGTQVRESVNEVAESFQYQNRQSWVEELGLVFYIHRSFSIIVLAVHGYLVYKLYQIKAGYRNLYHWGVVLVVTTGLTIISGTIMAYFGIPRFAQPVHLLLAVVAFGIQFLLILNLNSRRLFPANTFTKLSDNYVSY